MTKIVNTYTGGGGSPEQAISRGFTMAEILLSLTIIGVVAAITLPSLTGNINERTWNTQRKALYARMSQAISLMPALNGYGTLVAEQTDENGSITQSAIDNVAETFVTDGLAKVLKINNICDVDHLADCGFSNKLTMQNGSILASVPLTLEQLNVTFNSNYLNYKATNTNVAAFETVNGENILVYYNPRCVSDTTQPTLTATQTWTRSYFAPEKMCVNFVYDLNGRRGPNTFGKDMGVITAFYPTDSVVVNPVLVGKYFSYHPISSINSVCKQKYGDDVRAPNKEEMASMYINRTFLGMGSSGSPGGSFLFASSTSTMSEDHRMFYWLIAMSYGWYELHQGAQVGQVQCVKR